MVMVMVVVVLVVLVVVVLVVLLVVFLLLLLLVLVVVVLLLVVVIHHLLGIPDSGCVISLVPQGLHSLCSNHRLPSKVMAQSSAGLCHLFGAAGAGLRPRRLPAELPRPAARHRHEAGSERIIRVL